MSDDDQQYRYGQGQGQGQGQQHGHGPYGDQVRNQAQYDQYGRPQQPSYGANGMNGANGAYQDPGASQGWAGPQYQPQPQAHQEPAAQTWEGQTWDTQYQPHAQAQGPYYPAQGQAQGQAYQPQQAAAAADTAYLPPQGAYPLPPEMPSNVPSGVPSPASAPYAPQAPAAAGNPNQAPFTAAPGTTPPGSANGYSAPTTMGNARITDAQRARAEGRSPIIPPGIQPAGLTAVLGLLLAGGAAIGPYALLVPLVLLQAVTAAGWFRLNGMWPARQGIALAFLGGITADIAVLAAGRENAPAAIIGTLGVWVLLVVVLQLRSRASADERMTGLMATVASAALAILATGQLAAVPDAVVVGGVAVAAATVARALPLPGFVSVVVALLAGAGAGIAAGGMTDLGSQGALLGLGAGVCALVGLRAASYDYPSRFVHMTAGVALPLTAAAPAVYLLGRMLA
ncbi:hypothetical protein OG949_20895 [Streptomyces scopuliridis]|uniref:hypothetical protein n=1 Tax=Streptomyces scopuliridis TaxID=452529 RepID=UPI002DDAD7B7|nr:hypothetical protein [Streptomyces scopuliridis]WSB35062.1 hypothetical protein OG949_20895 [Streptomyces scopuliridis]